MRGESGIDSAMTGKRGAEERKPDVICVSGTVCALKLQEKKGAPIEERDTLQLVSGKGILGDRHFGGGDMQVCLAEGECHAWMEAQQEPGLCFARFHENICTSGITLSELSKGDWLKAGDALLEVTSVGKECFPGCPRRESGQECRLRSGCCFAKVIRDGKLALGDAVSRVEDKNSFIRYTRQLGLSGFGVEGQARIGEAKVLVIGAGGLGCPAIAALAEAGVGSLGIADGDAVEVSNLNRQFLYTPEDLGRPKAECAGLWVKRFRPDCRVKVWTCAFGREELEREALAYDLVLSCVDSMETRALVNQVCVNLGIPLVDGAIDGMYGTVQAVFSREAPCLVCVNPGKAGPAHISVSFGPVAMVIGALEAKLALQYLAGLIGGPGGLYSFDGESMTLEEIPAAKNPGCAICGKGPAGG